MHREVPQVQAPSPRTRTVTDAEVEVILSSASPAMRLFVLLCLDLGLRSGTAVKISPSHYDPNSGTISFTTKKQSTQTLPVTREIAVIFATCERCLPEVPYYTFLSVRRGGCRVSVALSFKHLLRRCGLDDRIRPHDLRRTAAERVYAVTKDMRDVQSVLGHKRLANTMHYLDRGGRGLSVAILEQAKILHKPTEVIQ
ncbi:tyrosine-type recombinase/integrase [Terriglobus sp. RCC_193]|uniref:tyrosine-type recombinase/integrase n=1 Tax=Terriglobus sp. RCC_193 TaxID=3239218 RepID=UPI0035254F9C